MLYSKQLAGLNYGMSTVIKSVNGNAKLSMTIDELELQHCHLIKIDVEGYELKVLNSAKSTIEKFKPILDIEVNDNTLKLQKLTDQDIYNWLKDNNYEIVETIGHAPQVDVIAIHKNNLK